MKRKPSMKPIFSGVVAAIAMLCAGAAAASAIHRPDQVFRNDFGEHNVHHPITRLIDGAGMSAGFTSGVTDYDAYAAAPPRCVHR